MDFGLPPIRKIGSRRSDPVDRYVENRWRFPAKIRVSAISCHPNSLFLHGKQGQTNDQTFSPTGNSADL